MMGRGHAMSGVAVWLMGCMAAEELGLHPDVPTIVLGAGVCAGSALLPDLDHPNSTIARSAGPVSRLVAFILANLSAFIHARTRSHWDRPDLDGHRTVTHTLVWAVACGGLATLAQQRLGLWAVLAMVFCLTAIGVKASLPVKRRYFRVRTGFRWRPIRRPRVSAGLAGAVLATGVAYLFEPGNGWWLGVAIAVGSVVHCLGDCLTNSACPMLWPLPIGPAGRRRRWYPVGPPPRLRFSAGDQTEIRIVHPVLMLVIVAAAGLVIWQQARPLTTGFDPALTVVDSSQNE